MAGLVPIGLQQQVHQTVPSQEKSQLSINKIISLALAILASLALFPLEGALAASAGFIALFSMCSCVNRRGGEERTASSRWWSPLARYIPWMAASSSSSQLKLNLRGRTPEHRNVPGVRRNPQQDQIIQQIRRVQQRQEQHVRVGGHR